MSYRIEICCKRVGAEVTLYGTSRPESLADSIMFQALLSYFQGEEAKHTWGRVILLTEEQKNAIIDSEVRLDEVTQRLSRAVMKRTRLEAELLEAEKEVNSVHSEYTHIWRGLEERILVEATGGEITKEEVG